MKHGRDFWNGVDSTPHVDKLNISSKGIIVNKTKPTVTNNTIEPIDVNSTGSSSNLLDSPTGMGIRNDAGGLGHYKAPRGNRLHGGIDFSSKDGQNIISPINGRVSNFIGNSGKPMLQLIPNDTNLMFDKIEMLYVGPPKGLNYSFSFRNVSVGEVIGKSINLQSFGYGASVGPHVHLQMFYKGVRIDPTPFFFK